MLILTLAKGLEQNFLQKLHINNQQVSEEVLYITTLREYGFCQKDRGK